MLRRNDWLVTDTVGDLSEVVEYTTSGFVAVQANTVGVFAGAEFALEGLIALPLGAPPIERWFTLALLDGVSGYRAWVSGAPVNYLRLRTVVAPPQVAYLSAIFD